jgi:hypothetical protein
VLALLTALLLLEAACTAGPRRVDLPTPAPLGPRQELELWQAGKPRTLHAVVQARDSISGVPVHRPPTCRSCRVTLALADIDSVRVVSSDRSALLAQGLVLGFAAAALVAWRISEGD